MYTPTRLLRHRFDKCRSLSFIHPGVPGQEVQVQVRAQQPFSEFTPMPLSRSLHKWSLHNHSTSVSHVEEETFRFKYRSRFSENVTKSFPFYFCHRYRTTGLNSKSKCIHLHWHQRAHLHSAIKQTVICDSSQDLNIDELRQNIEIEKRLQSNNETNCSQHFRNIVYKKVEEKCLAVIKNLNSADAKKLKLIKLEHDFHFTEGYEILPPEQMTAKLWLEAMTFSSMEERLEFYLDQSSTQPSQLTEPCVQDGDEASIGVVSSGHQDTASGSWKNHRLAHAMTHDLPLVLDLSFSPDLTMQQINHTARGLWEMYRTNRESSQPFHLMLSACSTTNAVFRYFQLFHAVEEPHLLASVRGEDPVDLFPRSQLVYLSSKATRALSDLDPNTIYIVGAYSSLKKERVFHCLKRARELNIQAMKLPIEEHVRWPKAPKNLDLQDVISIMLAVKCGQSWKEAFEHIIRHGSTMPDWIKEGKTDNNIIEPKQKKKRKSRLNTKD